MHNLNGLRQSSGGNRNMIMNSRFLVSIHQLQKLKDRQPNECLFSTVGANEWNTRMTFHSNRKKKWYKIDRLVAGRTKSQQPKKTLHSAEATTKKTNKMCVECLRSHIVLHLLLNNGCSLHYCVICAIFQEATDRCRLHILPLAAECESVYSNVWTISWKYFSSFSS